MEGFDYSQFYADYIIISPTTFPPEFVRCLFSSMTHGEQGFVNITVLSQCKIGPCVYSIPAFPLIYLALEGLFLKKNKHDMVMNLSLHKLHGVQK